MTIFREEAISAPPGIHSGPFIQVEFRNVEFSGRRENRRTQRKPLEQGEKQKQTQPT